MTKYRIVGVCFLALLLIGGCATMKEKRGISVRPNLKITIRDYVYFHNVGITSDDISYYTINGGNEEHGLINRYDLNGDLIDSEEVLLDGRALWYDDVLEGLLIKNYGYDLMWFEDGTLDLEDFDIFYHDNSSPAFSPDGEYIFEFYGGTATVYDGILLTEEYDIENIECGEDLFACSIAASEGYLFTWDEDGTVFVYDYEGNFVATFELGRTGFGLSLSWCNGMLWIAEDADGSTDGATGTWYGYELIGLP